MTARSMSSCRVKRVELAHVAFLLHRRARLIEHFEDQLSRQVVRQRLDQPTDFEWYTSAQRNSLQFDIHSAVALLESLHHNCAPDVSWPPGLYKRMLAGVAIVSDLLHAYSVAGDQRLVWGRPHNLYIVVRLHCGSHGKGLLHRNYDQLNLVLASLKNHGFRDKSFIQLAVAVVTASTLITWSSVTLGTNMAPIQ